MSAEESGGSRTDQEQGGSQINPVDKDPCQPIRDDIASTQAEIVSMQDTLSEMPPELKKQMEESIVKEKRHLEQLQRALRACEQARGQGAQA